MKAVIQTAKKSYWTLASQLTQEFRVEGGKGPHPTNLLLVSPQIHQLKHLKLQTEKALELFPPTYYPKYNLMGITRVP